jgi:hypothetical protein
MIIEFLKPLITAACNTALMTQLQGSIAAPRAVTVYDTRAITGDQENASIPYVKIYQDATPPRLITESMGMDHTRFERVLYSLEAVAQSDTRALADMRSEALLLAAEAVISNQKNYVTAGGLVFNDLGGSGSYNKVSNWRVLPGWENVIIGPSSLLIWTSAKTSKIEVWVEKCRKI